MKADAYDISVVLATFNRGESLKLLLGDLARQSLPASSYQVVVVDDGSKEPVAPLLADYQTPYALTVKTQKNGGAARARDAGVRAATGHIIIITDDDMRVDEHFLAAHKSAHERGATVVLGHIAASERLGELPVFERFHAHQLARFVGGIEAGRIRAHGVHVCTGNVSFRRQDYLRLGGFDANLQRSEDRELGVRLESDGGKLAFALDAVTRHESDHTDLRVWLRRAFHYGMYDRKISQKHPRVEMADPWRFFFLVSPLTRPLLLAAIALPGPMAHATELTMRGALLADKKGLGRAAIADTTVAYGLEYFRGMRTEAGSLRQCGVDFLAYWRKRAHR
jgi:GT2 family glycosyltransferase